MAETFTEMAARRKRERAAKEAAKNTPEARAERQRRIESVDAHLEGAGRATGSSAVASEQSAGSNRGQAKKDLLEEYGLPKSGFRDQGGKGAPNE